jgi:hypothetical protein
MVGMVGMVGMTGLAASRIARSGIGPAPIQGPTPHGWRNTYRHIHVWSLLGHNHRRYDAATNLNPNRGTEMTHTSPLPQSYYGRRISAIRHLNV